VQKAMQDLYTICNEAPTYYMWRQIEKGRAQLKERLATLVGSSKDELVLLRNTTEAINTVIHGIPFKRGDEVVTTNFDYPNTIHSYNQKAKRDGIKVVCIPLNLPEEDEDALVAKFVNAFTSRTKLVHITHVINWTGQILPVQKIAAEAKKRNIEVLVDGAHGLIQTPLHIHSLNVDYYSTSLHKWLGAPYGNGLLHIHKDKIQPLWPLHSVLHPQSNSITKFESVGTKNLATEFAIHAALDFNDIIGTSRRGARLSALTNRFLTGVKNFNNIKLNTTLHTEQQTAISSIQMLNTNVSAMENFLFQKYKIHCSNSNWATLTGLRISPNIYTSFQEVDQLITAFHAMDKW
jgi:selenocysteine lyase/cysteine desulfurase